jgi:hypothetical protein
MIGIRRLVIKTAEVLMIVLVILTIVASAITGAAAFGPKGGTVLGLVGAGLGAFVGLISSSIVASVFFLILEIADNTRRMLRYYEPSVERY